MILQDRCHEGCKIVHSNSILFSGKLVIEIFHPPINVLAFPISLKSMCTLIKLNYENSLPFSISWLHNKGKGKVTLFNVGSSFRYETGINGRRWCALYPCLCQRSVLRVFKAMGTRIRGNSKQTLKSLRIEPETSRSESRALANWATTAPNIYIYAHVFFTPS